MNENEMFDFISFDLLFKILSRNIQLLMQTAVFKSYKTAWTKNAHRKTFGVKPTVDKGGFNLD
jgi:hypothetical protein